MFQRTCNKGGNHEFMPVYSEEFDPTINRLSNFSGDVGFFDSLKVKKYQKSVCRYCGAIAEEMRNQ
jgi:hypothetical protein